MHSNACAALLCRHCCAGIAVHRPISAQQYLHSNAPDCFVCGALDTNFLIGGGTVRLFLRTCFRRPTMNLVKIAGQPPTRPSGPHVCIVLLNKTASENPSVKRWLLDCFGRGLKSHCLIVAVVVSAATAAATCFVQCVWERTPPLNS